LQLARRALWLDGMPAPPGNIPQEPVPTRTLVAIYLVATALVWIVFGQTLGHPFVQYDDQNYVYENPEITAGLTRHGLVAAFSGLHARNWHPLTTISHMLDCQLFGLNPVGHHFSSVLFHTLAALLLFSVLRAMTGALWRSAFVAAVFAIHPLRVESVAWVAERKDVLSALFFMLTLSAYVHYARQPSVRRYLWIVLLFALGLMAKPMLVTLPLLLLLLDYWPLARNQKGKPGWGKLIAEKIPLFFLSLLAAIATLIAQRTTISYSEELPLTWRIGNGLLSCVAYMGQMIWPAKLAVFYPHAADRLSSWQVALVILVMGGISALAFAWRKTRPYLGVGWLWYLIALLPVIGFIQVGLQGRADRYTYLPQIGLYIALTWALADWSLRSHKRRVILAGAVVVIVGGLVWQAQIQTSYWSSTESLWKHALEVTTDNDVAHYNVAALLLKRGQVDEAISHYEKALNIRSDNRETHYHLSVALLHGSLGNALTRKDRLEEALVHYRKAVELRDDFADAHSNLASLLARKGETVEAIAHYEKALAIPPEDAPSHLVLAPLLLQLGRKNEALAHYRRALEIAPDSVEVLTAFSWVLATSSDRALRNGSEAVTLAEKANRLSNGKNPFALRALAASYAELGRLPEAADTAQRALQSTRDPDLARSLERDIQSYQSGAALHRLP
jgi:Flp pilus assembly protein TadD